MSRVFDSEGPNDRLTILDLLKSTANGSIVLDLSKVPDQWVFDLLSDLNDADQPTTSRATVADSGATKVKDSKSSQRARPVKRARKRLRVARKTLKKTIPENRSKTALLASRQHRLQGDN